MVEVTRTEVEGSAGQLGVGGVRVKGFEEGVRCIFIGRKKSLGVRTKKRNGASVGAQLDSILVRWVTSGRWKMTTRAHLSVLERERCGIWAG